MIPDAAGLPNEQESVTLFHNPRCSTSRKALQLLRDAGHEPGVVEYLETGWTRDQLEGLLARLKARPADILRRKEPLARELGLTAGNASDHAILDAMVANPILVERPIAVRGQRARVGRPPEAVLDLLHERGS